MGNIYPICTTVEKRPNTICAELTEEVFNYPFFDDGISSSKINPSKRYNLHSTKCVNKHDSLYMSGFIFHTSHCGSTLLCRMLSQLKNVKIISEPEAINGLLLSQVFYTLKDEEIINHCKIPCAKSAGLY